MMDNHASYLTADESFVNEIIKTGLFRVKPFFSDVKNGRCIVEINFVDLDNDAVIELGQRNYYAGKELYRG